MAPQDRGLGLAKERSDLPGVSRARAHQLVAGGLVAKAAMDLFDIDNLEICPWALREGVTFEAPRLALRLAWTPHSDPH